MLCFQSLNGDHECASTPTVRKKQHTKTLVWLHFDLKAIKDGAVVISEQGKPIWMVCSQKVLAKGGKKYIFIICITAFYFQRMSFSQLYFEVCRCAISALSNLLCTNQQDL